MISFYHYWKFHRLRVTGLYKLNEEYGNKIIYSLHYTLQFTRLWVHFVTLYTLQSTRLWGQFVTLYSTRLWVKFVTCRCNLSVKFVTYGCNLHTSRPLYTKWVDLKRQLLILYRCAMNTVVLRAIHSCPSK